MDQKHKKNKRTLQILGCVFTVLGLALMITGFVDFFISANNSDMPSLFFLLFLGFPLVFDARLPERNGAVCKKRSRSRHQRSEQRIKTDNQQHRASAERRFDGRSRRMSGVRRTQR